MADGIDLNELITGRTRTNTQRMIEALMARAGQPNPSLGGALGHALALGLMGLYERNDEGKALQTALGTSQGIDDIYRQSLPTPAPAQGTGSGGYTSLPASSGSLTMAGDVPLPPPRPVFNRDAAIAELDAKPELIAQLSANVRGEVGDSASPEKKAIQLESLFNRVAAQKDKGMTLEKALYNGYYPPSTYARGPGDVEDFQKNILPAVLRGSDISGQTLGFPATGNASSTVATNGINNGRYSQYASIGGPAGARGVETYVQQPNIENIQQLEQTRVQPDGAVASPQQYAPQPATQQVAQAQMPQVQPDKMIAVYDRMAADPNLSTTQRTQAALAAAQAKRAFIEAQRALQLKLQTEDYGKSFELRNADAVVGLDARKKAAGAAATLPYDIAGEAGKKRAGLEAQQQFEEGQYARIAAEGIKLPNGQTVFPPPGMPVKQWADKILSDVTGAQVGNRTESQSNSTRFAARMRQAEPFIQGGENKISDWSSEAGTLGYGLSNTWVARKFTPEDIQQYNGAKRSFITGVLRKDSGALISDKDYQDADQMYFPQKGEGPKVVEQKRQLRELEMRKMEEAAGPAGAGETAGTGWVDLGGGVRIREKR